VVLKKKKITKWIKRVRPPYGMTLANYQSYILKLSKAYRNNKNIRVRDASNIAYCYGYWIVENRIETDSELAKRQASHDRVLAQKKARTLARREQAKIERQQEKRELEVRRLAEIQRIRKLIEDSGYEIIAR